MKRYDEVVETITAITPTKANARRATVKVGSRPVATLALKLIEELGLTVGRTWDEATAKRLAEMVELDKALRTAMRMVDRRALSRKRLEEKLSAKGFDVAVVTTVVKRLELIGAVNDAAMAEAVATHQPAGASLIRDKLERRGIDEELAERAASAHEADPRTLAREQLKKLARFDPATQRRRLFGFLARRGFTEEQALDALDALGLRDESDALDA